MCCTYDFFTASLEVELRPQIAQRVIFQRLVSIRNSNSRLLHPLMEKGPMHSSTTDTDDLNTNGIITHGINGSERQWIVTIDDLPDDCLIGIFKKLEIPDKLKAEQVCKRWHDISQKGWTDVKSLCLNDKYSNCSIVQATKLFRTCGRLLTSLRIPVKYERSIYLQLTQIHCRQLRKLELVFDYWAFRPVLSCYTKSLCQLFSKLWRLNSLVMEEINSNVLDKHLKAIPGGLESLEISGTPSDSMYVPFSASVSRFQNLRQLTLKYFTIKKGSLKGLERLDQLVELNLSFCDIPEEVIRRIQCIYKLEKLDLREKALAELDSEMICDDHISEIAMRCVKLRELRLDGCSKLTDCAFIAISTLKHLEVLDMEHISKVTNRAIVNLHQLRKLNCSYCPGITNVGLKQLIQESPNLTALKVHGTTDPTTFLQDASEAILQRTKESVLTIDLTSGDNSWVRPKDFPDSIVLL